jgi:hypothetical protein
MNASLLVTMLSILLLPLAGFANDRAPLQAGAEKLYAALTDEQRRAATLPFDSPERSKEVFTGGERAGLQIRQLTPEQQKLAMALLVAFTSDYGQRKAIEIADQAGADSTTGFGRYYLCFFGAPGQPGGAGTRYAWRIAEHHLTLVHVECSEGEPVTVGPILLGANPPTLWDAEEEKMLALYAAMTPAEREKSHQPGKGISTDPLARDDAARAGAGGGIRVGELGPSARQAAQAVLENRLSFFAEPIRARLQQILDSQGGLDAMRIGFYGKVAQKCREGGRWDFKLAGKTFLCDYEGSRGHIHLSMRGQLASDAPRSGDAVKP